MGTGLHRAALSLDSHCSFPQAWVVFASLTLERCLPALRSLSLSLSLSLYSRSLSLSLSLSLTLSRCSPPVLLYLQISLNECLPAASRPRVVEQFWPPVSRVLLLLLSSLAPSAPLPQESTLPREAAARRHRDADSQSARALQRRGLGDRPSAGAMGARSQQRANQRPMRVNVNLPVTPVS